MGKTIDSKVVEMKFDNKNFEENVSQSMSTLDKLKEKLNFKDSSKSLDELESKVSKSMKGIEEDASEVELTALEKAANTVSERFSALGIVATTVLQNITNSVMDTASQMLKSMTIQPIIDGFQEYELQINSIQTILANTKSKGTTLDQITSALDELNTYADKTIYNFAEMTHNIGTFTAAGIDLDTSVAAIKGFSNLAAASGANATSTARAMYQLSQGLAAGTIRLLDWRSMETAGIGGELFKNAILETARVHGVAIDEMIKKEGSFQETLSEGWLTTEIMMETLQKFTGDLSRDQILQMGYTEEQADQIIDLANTANDAATKVKTFSQLVDTVGEMLGSGWASSWQTIIGDFEEAEDLYTNISKIIEGMINESSEARNKILSDWKDLGGRDDVIEGAKNVFEGTISVVNALRDALRDIFPPITAQNLADLSSKFKEFTERIKPSEETLDKIKRTAKGVFSAIDLLRQALGSILGPIADFIGGKGIGALSDALLTAAASIGDWITEFRNAFLEKGTLSAITNVIRGVLDTASDAIEFFSNKFKESFNNIGSFGEVFEKIFSKVRGIVTEGMGWITENFTLQDVLTSIKITGGLGFLDVLADIIPKVKSIADSIKGMFEVKGASLVDLILGDVVDSVKSIEIAENFDKFMTSVHSTLQAFTSGIKVATLLTLSGSIMILSSSLRTLTSINALDLTIAVAALKGIMSLIAYSLDDITGALKWTKFGQLAGAAVAIVSLSISIKGIVDAIKELGSIDIIVLAQGFISMKLIISSLTKFLSKNALRAISPSVGVALISLAASLKIIEGVMKTFGEMGLDAIISGLAGLAGAMLSMSVALKIIGKTKISVSGMAGMIVLATSIRMLSKPMREIGELDWEHLARSLSGMAGAMAILVTSSAVLKKFSGAKSILGAASALILVQTLAPIIDAMKDLSSFDPSDMAKSLGGMAVALSELSLVLVVLSKFSTVRGSLSGAASVLILSITLKPISDALKNISGVDWDGIGRGLSGIAGVFATMTLALVALDKLGGNVKNITSALSLLIVVQALDPIVSSLERISGISWDGISKSLTGLLVSLGSIALITGLSGRLAGLSGVIGSVSLLIAVQALKPIADALNELTGISWENLGKSITGLVSVLTALALITGLEGSLAGLNGLLGADTLLKSVQTLGPIANALNSLSGLDWEDIGIGVVGLGSVLGSLALITGLEGTLAGFSGFIGAGTLLVAVQALKPVADVLEEMSTMSWDGIEIAVGGLVAVLGTLALITGLEGGLTGLFGLVGAGTLLVSVQALKPVADALSSLTGMSWEEIKTSIAGFALALGSLALISGLEGSLTGLFGLIGSGSLLVASLSLAPVAEALQKFGAMEWESVQRGLEAMDQALGVVAWGALKNTLSGIGGLSLGAIAQPIGDLADSVKKWENVNLSPNLGIGLGILADGVGKFTLSGFGAGAIRDVAEPLGIMADSVQKWEGVTIPEDLGDNLRRLGLAVMAFGPQFFNGMKDVAEPLGVMADSVKKWEDVSVREDIGENLAMLADGVGEFNFDFFVGGNMSSIVDPLKNMAASVNEWNNVTVPDDIQQNLEALQKGVGSFAMDFFTGGNLAGIVGPLKDMADSIRNWDGVKFPTDYSMELELYGVKNGLAAMSQLDSGKLADAVTPTGDMAGAVSEWSTVTFNKDFSLEAELYGLKNGLESVTELDSEKLGSLQDPLANMATSVSAWSTVTFPDDAEDSLKSLARGLRTFSDEVNGEDGFNFDISSVIEGIENILSNLQAYSERFETLGRDLLQSIGNGFSSGFVDPATVYSVIEEVLSKIGSYSEQFHAKGAELSTALSNGMSETINVSGAFTGAIDVVVALLSSAYPLSFFAIGASFVSSFNSGMSSVSIGTGVLASVGILVGAIGGYSSQMASKGTLLMKSLCDMMVQTFTANMSRITSTLETGMTSILNSVLAIVNRSASKFSEAGGKLMTSMASGITLNGIFVSSAVSGVMSSIERAVSNDYKSSFYSLGVDMMDGLRNGINSKANAVAQAAALVAATALAAAKAAVDSNSPSKKFAELGRDSDQGLANGFMENIGAVTSASRKVSEESLEVMRSTISRVSKYANMEIDANPKITPVLDLSNIQNGIGILNGMMGDRRISASIDPDLIPKDVRTQASIIAEHQMAVQKSNEGVLTALNDLNTLVGGSSGESNTGEISLYIDSRKVASTTAKAMNRELSILSRRGSL